jgi:DNA-binding protein H-NS
MAKQGYTDTDKGLADIFKEVEKFKSLCVKVGVTEDVGSQLGKHFETKTSKSGKKTKRKVQNTSGPTIAEYATWNELGTADGRIPPRPFVRGWIDNNREQIGKTLEKLYGLVSDGKLDAMTAIERLGRYGESGVKSYIRNGTFTPNADSTIAKKGSSKPLIDTGTLRNSIRYQVIKR